MQLISGEELRRQESMEELIRDLSDKTRKIKAKIEVKESVHYKEIVAFLRTAKELDEKIKASQVVESGYFEEQSKRLLEEVSIHWEVKALEDPPEELLGLPRVEKDRVLYEKILATPLREIIQERGYVSSTLLEEIASFLKGEKRVDNWTDLKEEIKREIREELVRELRREEIDVESLKARIRGEIEGEMDGLLNRIERLEKELSEIRIRIEEVLSMPRQGGGGEDLRVEIERLRSEIRDLEFRIKEEISQTPSSLPLPEIEEIRMRLMELEEKLQDQKPVESFSPPPVEEERTFFVEEEVEGVGREQKEEEKPVERKKKGLGEVLMNNWQIVVGAIGVLLAILLWFKK